MRIRSSDFQFSILLVTCIITVGFLNQKLRLLVNFYSYPVAVWIISPFIPQPNVKNRQVFIMKTVFIEERILLPSVYDVKTQCLCIGKKDYYKWTVFGCLSYKQR